MSNRDANEIFEVEQIEEISHEEVGKKDLKGIQKYKMKVKEFILDKHIIVIVFLVAIIVIEFLLINNKSKLLRMIFLSKDNEFQWLAGTAIAAMLTFFCTTIIALRKNKADLVAKSRIEWIQEVRKDSSKLISASNNFISSIYSLARFMNETNTSISDPGVNKSIKKIDSYQLIISEYMSKLQLYFPIEDSDGKNKRVIDVISEAVKVVFLKSDSNQSFRGFDISPILQNPEEYASKSELEIVKITNVISSYLKEEWEKAKKGQ